jgi:hypothetical protein
MPGYRGNIYVIVDISDPRKPKERGRWWVKGQHQAGGEVANDAPSEAGSALAPVSLHGPPYVVGNRAYLPYGAAGMIVLDIADVSRPREIGRLDFSPPFHDVLGVHTVLPVPERGVAYVNSEDVSYGKGPATFAAIVDIGDPPLCRPERGKCPLTVSRTSRRRRRSNPRAARRPSVPRSSRA